MEEYIKKFKEIESKLFEKVVHLEPESCEHDFITTGVIVCQKCGMIDGVEMVSRSYDGCKIIRQSKEKISCANRASYRKYVVEWFFGITSKPQPPIKFDDRTYTLSEIISTCKKNKISPQSKYHYFYIANKIKNINTNDNVQLLQGIMDHVSSREKGNTTKICFYLYFLGLEKEDVADLIIPRLSKKNRKIVQEFVLLESRARFFKTYDYIEWWKSKRKMTKNAKLVTC